MPRGAGVHCLPLPIPPHPSAVPPVSCRFLPSYSPSAAPAAPITMDSAFVPAAVPTWCGHPSRCAALNTIAIGGRVWRAGGGGGAGRLLPRQATAAPEGVQNGTRMLSSNELRPGTTVEMDGSVWRVTEFLHVKPGKGAAFVRTKLKNMENGAALEKTFKVLLGLRSWRASFWGVGGEGGGRSGGPAQMCQGLPCTYECCALTFLRESSRSRVPAIYRSSLWRPPPVAHPLNAFDHCRPAKMCGRRPWRRSPCSTRTWMALTMSS